MSNLPPNGPGAPFGNPEPPTNYNQVPNYSGGYNAGASQGIMQTAKWGMYGLISTGIGFVLGILQLPLIPGLFGLAGLVMAIMSLVKKERPKWPAWVTIGLAIAGFLLALLLFGLLAALFAVGASNM